MEGLLSEERMKKLLRRYESENREVSFKMEVLRRDTGTEKKEDAMEQLRKMLHGFTEPEELSRELLFHFIDHIEMGREVSGKRNRGV